MENEAPGRGKALPRAEKGELIMKKKLAALLVTLALAASLIPTGAYALEPTKDYVEINDTKYEVGEITVGEGTATWDQTTHTLTLDNVHLEGYIYISSTTGSVPVTILLKGENTITTPQSVNSHGIKSEGAMSIRAENGASLSVTMESYKQAFYIQEGDLTISGGTYTLTSDRAAICAYSGGVTIADGANITAEANEDSAISASTHLKITGAGTTVNATGHYRALHAETGSIAISDGAQVKAVSTNDSALWTPSGTVTVTGAGSSLNARAQAAGFCAVNAMNGVSVLDGASLTAHTESDHPVYSKKGEIVLANATVNITSNYQNAVGLYAGSDAEGLVITNSTVDVNTKSTSLFSKGDVSIADSTVNIVSETNPIRAKKNVVVTGQETNLTASGANPIAADGTIQIDGAAVSATATSGTTLSGAMGVAIQNGARVNVSTTAKMSALYSLEGDILVAGDNTVVAAESSQDSAIFARNGEVIMEAGAITATAAEGFSPIVARAGGNGNNTDPVPAAEEKIQIGQGLTLNGAKVAATNWKTASDGSYYSDTLVVPANTELDENGLLQTEYTPVLNKVTVNKYVAPTPTPTPDQGGSGGSEPAATATPAPEPTATPQPLATARPVATPTPQPTVAPAPVGETVVTTTAEAVVEDATAVVTVETTQFARAVETAVSEAADAGTAPAVEVQVTAVEGAEAIQVALPADTVITLAAEEGATLAVTSDLAQVHFDAQALNAIAEQAEGESELVLVVSPVAVHALTEAQSAAVGQFPVVELTLQSGDKVISDFSAGSATVTLPYALAEGQRAEGVVVWYVDDNGATTPCDTSYDEAAGLVTFTTPHFSKYAIAYDESLLPAQPQVQQPAVTEPAAEEEGGLPVLPIAIGAIAVVVLAAALLLGKLLRGAKDDQRGY